MCTHYDILAEKGDWIEDEGCITTRLDRYFVRCDCNHLSIFGVLVVNIHVHQSIVLAYKCIYTHVLCRTQIQSFVVQVMYPMRTEQLVLVSLKILLTYICLYLCGTASYLVPIALHILFQSAITFLKIAQYVRVSIPMDLDHNCF